MPTATNKQVISAMYSAVFNRAPDAAGLGFWEVQFAANANSIATLAAGFTNHPVFTETYGGMTDSTFVEAIYQNVLGAPGDAGGVDYWKNQLSSGVTRSDMLAAFVDGALTIDLAALKAAGQLTDAEFTAAVARQDQLTNKADVGLQFAALLGANSNLDPATDTTTAAGLNADPAYLASVAAIRSVTNDPQTALDAITFLNTAAADADPIAYVNTNAPGAAAVVGQTFTLTTGIDNFVGTAGNDTINAVSETTAASTTSTYQTGDQISGGAGTDTLSLIMAGDGTGASGVVTASGVEVLKVQDLATGSSSLNLANFTGTTEIQSVGSTNVANTSFINASGITAVTLKDLATASTDVTVTLVDAGYTGTADAMTINLSNVTAAETLTVQAATTAAGIETFNVVSGAVKNTGVVTLASAMQTGVTKQTVNVSGATDVNLAVSTNMTTVNAASLTGGLKLDVSGAADYTVTGGTGSNRYDFAGNFNASDKIAGGAGTDTLATTSVAVNATLAGFIDGKTAGVNNNSSIEVLEYTGTAAYAIDASLIQMATLKTYSTSGAIAAANDAVGVAVTAQSNDQSFVFAGNVTGGTSTTSAGIKGVSFASAVDNGANALNITLSGSTITGGTSLAGVGVNNGGTALDASNFETITIVSTGTTATATNALTGGALGGGGTGAVGSTLVVSANTTVNISGANDLNLGLINSGNTPVTVAATGLSGQLTLSTGTAADVITGGSGKNLITLTGGVDAVNLSASTAKADQVILTAATNTTSTSFVQVTGFTNAATTGDKLDVIGTGVALTDKAIGQVSGVTNLTFGVANGVMSFAGSAAATATLADKITAAFSTSGINATDNAVLAFEHAGSTYVVNSNDTTQGFNAGVDEVIQLVGMTSVTGLSADASAANTIFVV